ncbi:hypothetical protein HanHA300_Chr14g0514341 [Helianthus annuus]|nr:hypothetical protein HanHA300_Chr14g0514341 [Helianthus annuus]
MKFLSTFSYFVSVGYGRAWVGAWLGSLLKKKANRTWPTQRIGASHIGLLAHPTPDFKLPPLGPRPNPSTRGGGLGVFSQYLRKLKYVYLVTILTLLCYFLYYSAS